MKNAWERLKDHCAEVAPKVRLQLERAAGTHGRATVSIEPHGKGDVTVLEVAPEDGCGSRSVVLERLAEEAVAVIWAEIDEGSKPSG